MERKDQSLVIKNYDNVKKLETKYNYSTKYQEYYANNHLLKKNS